MNELSEELSDCKTGFMLGNTTVNHYMYADDLVVLVDVPKNIDIWISQICIDRESFKCMYYCKIFRSYH